MTDEFLSSRVRRAYETARARSDAPFRQFDAIFQQVRLDLSRINEVQGLGEAEKEKMRVDRLTEAEGFFVGICNMSDAEFSGFSGRLGVSIPDPPTPEEIFLGKISVLRNQGGVILKTFGEHLTAHPGSRLTSDDRDFLTTNKVKIHAKILAEEDTWLA